jgi:hypothetical protein
MNEQYLISYCFKYLTSNNINSSNSTDFYRRAEQKNYLSLAYVLVSYILLIAQFTSIEKTQRNCSTEAYILSRAYKNREKHMLL